MGSCLDKGEMKLNLTSTINSNCCNKKTLSFSCSNCNNHFLILQSQENGYQLSTIPD